MKPISKSKISVYYYRAVDKFGGVIDYYLTPKRDEAAAKAFLNKAICQNGLPEKVVIDGSKIHHAAIDVMNVQLWLSGFFYALTNRNIEHQISE